MLDGFAIFVLGVAMPIIIAEFHIQPGVVGLIGASLVFGAVFGAGLGGPMADHLGRKKLMLADMIIITAGAAPVRWPMDRQCFLSDNFSLGSGSASISLSIAVTFPKFCPNLVVRE